MLGTWSEIDGARLMEFAYQLSVVLTWCWFFVTGLALARFDYLHHRLPNLWVAMTAVGCVGGFFAAAALSNQWMLLGRAVICGIVLMLAYGVASLLGGMGMGDAKYALVIGTYLGWLGWEYLWWGTFIAFALAAIYSIWVHFRESQGSNIPFGPFMVCGVIIAGIAYAG